MTVAYTNTLDIYYTWPTRNKTKEHWAYGLSLSNVTKLITSPLLYKRLITFIVVFKSYNGELMQSTNTVGSLCSAHGASQSYYPLSTR